MRVEFIVFNDFYFLSFQSSWSNLAPNWCLINSAANRGQSLYLFKGFWNKKMEQRFRKIPFTRLYIYQVVWKVLAKMKSTLFFEINHLYFKTSVKAPYSRFRYSRFQYSRIEIFWSLPVLTAQIFFIRGSN